MVAFRSAMEGSAFRQARRLERVHWSDLEKFGVTGSTARKFLQRWEQQGAIEQVDSGDSRKVFAWAGEPEAAAQVPSYDASPEGNMWRAMRRLGRFTPLDIAAHSNAGGIEITERKAVEYCKTLALSGYLRVRASAVKGERLATYQLIKNTGPNAPKARRVRGVVDPNTGEFTAYDRGVS